METFALVISYAIPFFIILIIIEYFISLWVDKAYINRSLDTISSLSSGMTNILKDLLGLSVVIVSYAFLVDHLAVIHLPKGMWQYIACFILVDFASYWSHRWNHEINLMWNRHIVHHSSEEFNLSCALRQSISGLIGVYFFLSIPMALIGIPVEVLAVVSPLHLFAQFWYHTRLVGKMGWLEHIIVTPSHHRVHHAINPEYIDKNFAAIFIIWDKAFGTFKEEEEDIAPVYGVKRAVRTWNPFIINYQHLTLLVQDMIRTESWMDKVKIWYMPTGWRPKDVVKKYPISVINDVTQQEKYDPKLPSWLVKWSWFQLIFHSLLIYFLLINIAEIDIAGIMLYASFLACSIFAYTSLMDLHYISIAAELTRFVIGVYIAISTQWFGLGELVPFFVPLLVIYLLLSLALTVYCINQAKALMQQGENLSFS